VAAADPPCRAGDGGRAQQLEVDDNLQREGHNVFDEAGSERTCLMWTLRRGPRDWLAMLGLAILAPILAPILAAASSWALRVTQEGDAAEPQQL
jgi:hypothetical protein